MGLLREDHPSPSLFITGERNLLQRIDETDTFASLRDTGEVDVHYPFASRQEWQLAKWLASAPLSRVDINKFLQLDYIQQQPPSFTSAQDLINRVEVLPEVPRWSYQTIVIPSYKTKSPMTLFWRDGLEVVAHLFANPVFAHCMEFSPYALFEKEDRIRAYGEFMSGQFAWDYHSSLPKGHTVLGVIGASDKTPLTIGTGNKEMHPVLFSLTNIKAGVQMKATANAFTLGAYLPIPKFLDVSPTVHAALVACVYHSCLDIICANLKTAERDGILLSDPFGNMRHCHTPLASWIADLPKQQTLACLLGLNGVHKPFWGDWGRANPCFFLTIDVLHAFHKFFFDHPIKWITSIMGGDELDRRMVSLQPRVSERHWRNGISKLKQVTGREHRDIQKIIISMIAGAVPNNVLCAIRALVEFIFQAQGLLLYEDHLHSMEQALPEFHHYKSSIILAGGRRGKKGIIPHFRIPKLEGFIQAVWSTRMMGAPYQYTSDTTERCHQTHVKAPYRRSNRHNFEEQCCRFMERIEKMRQFNLYVSLKYFGASLVNEMINEASDLVDHYPEVTWLSQVLPPGDIVIGSSVIRPSLFHSTRRHLSDDRTAAFTVNKKPHQKLTVDAAATLFNISNFRASLGDFFVLNMTYAAWCGQRKSSASITLPFTHVNIWHTFRMQQQSSQDKTIMLPSHTIQALPPSPSMPHGQCNTVLVNDADGSAEHTSTDEASGCKVMQVKLLFSLILSQGFAGRLQQAVFFYGESFKFSSAHQEVVDGVNVFKPAPNIDMFLLHRHMRSNGQRMGDIVCLTDIREVVELVPNFGVQMDDKLDCNNSLNIPNTFYLNNFADKEMFHSILSYQ
ncbi:hypothetical protein PILCRDRAFT_61652 [Piloderma croceum F 1598]|uniref:DUF6830 domain-containing protein n=1 Tax=Piloderma croceum (strain F 1598) TaxID=765440 RepID=A0A0C3GEB6_PILCF|nr:hypothetical protein PILCRDRAFT_61652 [Piloderma croceum F 1598]